MNLGLPTNLTCSNFINIYGVWRLIETGLECTQVELVFIFLLDTDASNSGGLTMEDENINRGGVLIRPAVHFPPSSLCLLTCQISFSAYFYVKSWIHPNDF
ncbi:hypothetical protein AAZV13_18G094600 [Glycine max]